MKWFLTITLSLIGAVILGMGASILVGPVNNSADIPQASATRNETGVGVTGGNYGAGGSGTTAVGTRQTPARSGSGLDGTWTGRAGRLGNIYLDFNMNSYMITVPNLTRFDEDETYTITVGGYSSTAVIARAGEIDWGRGPFTFAHRFPLSLGVSAAEANVEFMGENEHGVRVYNVSASGTFSLSDGLIEFDTPGGTGWGRFVVLNVTKTENTLQFSDNIGARIDFVRQ